MNCIKILLLVSLIPLALRGASLLGGAVVPSPSPDSGSTSVAPVVQVEKWRHQRRRIVGRQNGRSTVAFAPRRFGGGAGFFRDDKRFAPTGSNPLHNL
jgi:hypothetical protein